MLESLSKEEYQRYLSVCANIDNMSANELLSREKRLLRTAHTIGEATQHRIIRLLLSLIEKHGTMSFSELCHRTGHICSSRKTIAKILRSLASEQQIIAIGMGRNLAYSWWPKVDRDSDHLFELGAPVVYLPGTRSQSLGVVVEFKKKAGTSDLLPVLQLENGSKVLISKDVAVLDLDRERTHRSAVWIEDRINLEPVALTRDRLVREAFQAQIDRVSPAIKHLENNQKIFRCTYRKTVSYCLKTDFHDLLKPEYEILKAIASGVCRNQLSIDLWIHKKSLDCNLKIITKKLGCTDIPEAIELFKSKEL